ncbi:MAG: tRNA (adenosine(37)-N6)-dimethylallyltransferase MiaA [Thermoanaerobaculia bacterium]|nr:tRNA (adenosine(37)-N6)-dimethylallyltransferase MiaA [Thermoanaerobaculia bacterium]
MILGPTATGKSALSLRLATELDGEIVNADALQVYRGFDLGTAKPSREDRERIPHHLVDVLDPEEPYSAGEFARRARGIIRRIRRRGKLPIVVGGSGLYIRALTEGLSPMPPPDRTLRRGLRVLEERQGLDPMRRMLSVLDPELDERLASGDTQRILRGVEVALGTGRPLTWWQNRPPPHPSPGLPLRLGLTLPRSILYDRIARRVDRMIAAGWVEEVEALLNSGIEESAPAFQAIGYRELARHLRGGLGLDRAVTKIVQATRRFAKRQMTWFRKEPDVTWFPAHCIDEEWPELLRSLEEWMEIPGKCGDGKSRTG